MRYGLVSGSSHATEDRDRTASGLLSMTTSVDQTTLRGIFIRPSFLDFPQRPQLKNMKSAYISWRGSTNVQGNSVVFLYWDSLHSYAACQSHLDVGKLIVAVGALGMGFSLLSVPS
jgi:hypothetical protein